MNATLEELNSEVATLKRRMDVADSSAMQTKQLLTDLKSDVGDVKSDLGALQEVVTGGIQDLKGETAPLYGIVEAVPVDIGKINTNVADVKREVLTLGDEVSKLKTITAFVVSGMTTLKGQVADLTADLAIVKTDMSGMKADVSDLKIDMSGIKADVSGLKADISGIKSDTSGLKGHVGRMDERQDRMDERQDRMDGNVADLKRGMGAIMRHLGIEETGESQPSLRLSRVHRSCEPCAG